ncbi:response regulator [Primorskyibacter sp. 2E107]|uniref:response regulator n=1 Tax=Primorskyibacter sp. 2E107 TaxID=3403458 RepID=UPI003AF9C451
MNPLALLVEDESPKLAHIRKFVRESFSNISVVDARSVSSALEAIETEDFDFMLLDMSLPTFDVGQGEQGGRPQGFGGIEILRHLEMSGTNLQTIVLTGYEAFPDETGELIGLETLRNRMMDEFPLTVRQVVHFSSSLEGWKVSLRDGISSILGSRKYG